MTELSSATGRIPPGTPVLHRLLLRAYPRWFRDESGPDLLQYMARQRREPRYRGLGALRFLWDAGSDALVTGVTLRVERLRDRWVERRGAAPIGVADRLFGGDGPVTTTRGKVMMGLEAIMRDVRHALRGLIKNPAYTAVFIMTLSLGIGLNTAMFSAVNGVLLRPLPHEDGDRLVYLRHSASVAGIENALFSVPEIEDYRQGVSSLNAVAEFSALTFTMLGHGDPLRVRSGIVTGNYFGMMGLSPTLGRMVGPEDDGEGAPSVIVLSHAYWRNTFGSDPEIVGKTVQINGRTSTIVGVAEPAPPYPERTDIYVNMATSPHHLSATMSQDRVHRMTEVFARLSPGASVESASVEVSDVTARIHAEFPEAYDAGSGYGVSVTALKTQLTSRARPTLLLLLGTSFFVLLIACANLANLTLTRVLRRDHELAVRVSLGGSRMTLRRELLVESLILAVAGALLGLVIASASVDLLVAFAGRFTSRASEIALDGSVFGFALLAAVLASAFFTLVPTLPSGDRVGDTLTRGTGRATVGSGAKRAQRALVVAQICTSFVLLLGAGLLLRSMLHLNRVDPGFDTAQVLTMNIPANAAGRTQDDVRVHYLTVLDEIRTLPGVDGAAMTSAVPLRGTGGILPQFELDVDGHEPVTGAPAPRADFRVVSSGYFSSMGIDVLRGREFQGTDREGSRLVVIINESMAEAYFGDRDPIGAQIAWTDEQIKFLGLTSDWRTVVGVVEDTRDGGLDTEAIHTMYTPYQQVVPWFAGSLVVRMNVDQASVLPAVREVLLARDPNQPIDGVATIEDLGRESVAPQRLNALLLGSFALLALVIAAVGIGAVLAFSVGSRRREFGIRSALGAARHQVWSGVLIEGASLAGLGIVLGSVIAIGLARFISGLLVGVPALDPVTFLAVGLILAAVAILAAWVPAWRAGEVSPVEALASE